jgi:tetratricopeptide (TPR) repeat protein
VSENEGYHLSRVKISAVVLLAGGLTACVLPAPQREADKDVAVAAVAQQKADWDNARRAYAKVIADPELANADPKKQAILHYEYGRALGVTCFFDLAEAELTLAYELDKQSSGPVYLTLVELARLNLDQKKYAQSVRYFERALPELESVNAATEAPMAFAEILDEYAVASRAVDRTANAETLAERAAALRAANPDEQSIIDRTPYGKQCTKI